MKPLKAKYRLGDWWRAMVLAAALTAAGCGGSGGGSGDGVTEPPAAPPVDDPVDEPVDEPPPVSGPVDPSTLAFEPRYLLEERVLVSIPTDWDVANGAMDDGLLAQFAEPVESDDDLYIENILFARVEYDDLPPPLDPLDPGVISIQTRSIDGVIATEFVYDFALEAVPIGLRILEILIEQPEFVLLMLYTGEREGFDRNIEVVRAIADSIRVGSSVLDGVGGSDPLGAPGSTPIATDGTNFLVVSCRTSDEQPFPSQLVGQLLDAKRQILARELIIHDNVNQPNDGCRNVLPDISFDGSNYLVTYLGPLENRRTVFGRRISPGGALLDTSPIVISSSDRIIRSSPAVADAGSRQMVVWYEAEADGPQQLLGALVSPDGTVSDSFVVMDGLSELYPEQVSVTYRPSIAAATDRVMVAVEPNAAFEPRQQARPVYAQILDFSGATLLPAPLLVREDIEQNNPRYVQVASDSQSFLVTWVEGLLSTNTTSSGQFGVYGRQVGLGGQLIDGEAGSPGIEVVPEGTQPIDELNTTFANGEYTLLWSRLAGDERGIYMSTLSGDLSTVTPSQLVSGTRSISVSNFAPTLSTPGAATSSDATLYVWLSRDREIEVWRKP